MTWVPWQELGICKHWAVRPEACVRGESCKWAHPPWHVVKAIWDQHQGDEERRERAQRLGQNRFGRPPPPPSHQVNEARPTNEPRSLFDRIECPAHVQQQGPAVSEDHTPGYGGLPWIRSELPTGDAKIGDAITTQAVGGKEERKKGIGSLFAASSLDAPSSPDPEANSGSVTMSDALEKPRKRKPTNYFALKCPSQIDANNVPLGGRHRLLHRAELTESSSSVLGSSVYPTATARTIWKRDDQQASGTFNTEHENKCTSPAPGGYWERLRASRAALKEDAEDKKVGGDVGEIQASASAEKQPTGSKISRLDIERPTSSMPPPPPKQASSLLLPTSAQGQTSPSLDMGATKRLSNGEAKHVGPHPSTIRVSAQYSSQTQIDRKLQPPGLDAQEKSQAEAREDSLRLQGVAWLDNVRRALQLPIRTFTTACVYYHKFRLAHPGVEYNSADATAAALLTACKVEDTLKKSKDILAAAYNLKASGHDQMSADDVMFEAPSKIVIGVERMVLEAAGFDFRSRHPHQLVVKIGKSLPESDEKEKVAKVAWTILTDLHRTFAPLKQTSATLALASLELSAHLTATVSRTGSSTVRDHLQAMDLNTWSTTREEVMETLLDALDLYTHHTTSTILGTKYSLDDFLRIRLALNKECAESNLPRYTTEPEPSADRQAVTGTTLRVANGHPTPVSPPEAPGVPGAQSQDTAANVAQTGQDGAGTLRFILNPQLAVDEKTEVQKYFTEEWEEYEQEIEVPLPRARSKECERERNDRLSADRTRDPDRSRRDVEDRRSVRDERDVPRDRERDRLRDRERELERERVRLRERERDRRYDDRSRYDERDRFERRDRRYDEREMYDRRDRH